VLDHEVLAVPQRLLEEARCRSEEMAVVGSRVLAVAERAGHGPPTAEYQETGLELLGLIALQDPPREAAIETVRACQAAGITIVLVTGDHPATAQAIASQVGISRPGTAPLDLRRTALPALETATDHVVLARATPADKLTAVQAWQGAGHVVAMTGDGVNDGPALRRADIGVAMGGRGTEVARQAADLVLADDDLRTVVAAVEEGRRVYANIRRFLLYGLSGGAAEILVMLAGPFVGLPLPLLPGQILWVNLLTHSFAGAALGSEPVEAGSMTRPPRNPREGVLGSGLWWRVLVVAAFLAALSMAVGAVSSSATARTATMLVLGAGQLGVAWGVRARYAPGTPRNRSMPWAIAGAAAMLVAAVVLPPLQALLSTTALAAAYYAAALGAAVAAYLLVRGLRTPAPGARPAT
jgi:Ca2+-transporting ATPase